MADASKKVLFKFGNQAAYDALRNDSAEHKGYEYNALYFIEDTHRLYKGEFLMSEQVVVSSTVPSASEAEEGKIYIVTNADGSSGLWVKNGDTVVSAGGGTVQDGAIKSIDAFDNSVLDTSEDLGGGANKIPTSDAVKNYVDGIKGTIDTAIGEANGKIDGLIEKDPIVNAEVGTSAEEGKFTINFSRASGTNPVSIELVREQYLLDAKIEKKLYGEPPVEQDCLVLIVRTYDASGVEGTREVVIPLGEIVKIDATNVKTTDKIIVTQDVGNYKKGQEIPASDIQSIIMNLLCKPTDPVIASNPSISSFTVSPTEAEVGATVTPSATTAFSTGSYTAGGAATKSTVAKDPIVPVSGTGVTASTWSIKQAGVEIGTTVGTVNGNSATMTDAGISFTADCTYSAGNYALSNVNTLPETDVRITAGSASQKTARISGYRKMFYGASTASGALDSVGIRALAGGEKASKKAVTFTAAEGSKQVVIAFPATLTSSDPTFEYMTLGWTPSSGWQKSTVQVSGAAAGQNMTNYTVWTLTANLPADTQYRITIK